MVLVELVFFLFFRSCCLVEERSRLRGTDADDPAGSPVTVWVFGLRNMLEPRIMIVILIDMSLAQNDKMSFVDRLSDCARGPAIGSCS